VNKFDNALEQINQLKSILKHFVFNIYMKSYNNLYSILCSSENIRLAYEKARKGKSKNKSVIEFEKNLHVNLYNLREELMTFSYKPLHLKRFIIRDPKSRVIHASAFRDRIIHHAIINVLILIYEKIFIYDSYASRIDKGVHQALSRFDLFKRKVSRNGKRVRSGGVRTANSIEGYVLKCDIKHYFDTVDHEVLLSILRRKIKDENLIQLIKKVLDNFESPFKGKGMPLGNYTSQFFANVYLNELDYFVKHILRAQCYIRYVDDFIILHRSKEVLELWKKRIENYLECLKIELHTDKSIIIPLKNGVTFLGYRVFYYCKLLRRRNTRHFKAKLAKLLDQYKSKEIKKGDLIQLLQGWFGYAKWANTYKFRQKILKVIENIERERV